MSILFKTSLPHLDYVVSILPLITLCHTCFVLYESTVYRAVLSFLNCRVSDPHQPFSSTVSLSLHTVAIVRRLREAWNSHVLYTRTIYLLFVSLSVGTPGSVVGTATCYGLDGPGIESRWGRDFPHLSIPALRPTQPPIEWVPGLSRG